MARAQLLGVTFQSAHSALAGGALLDASVCLAKRMEPSVVKSHDSVGERSRFSASVVKCWHGNESSLNVCRRTVNLRRPERARNEGSTGPNRLDDALCTTYGRRSIGLMLRFSQQVRKRVCRRSHSLSLFLSPRYSLSLSPLHTNTLTHSLTLCPLGAAGAVKTALARGGVWRGCSGARGVAWSSLPAFGGVRVQVLGCLRCVLTSPGVGVAAGFR